MPFMETNSHNRYSQSTTTHHHLQPRSYGSHLNTSHKLPSSLPTSRSMNISPNDDDESLYLLWTHQLLVERGFNPTPIGSKYSIDDNNHDDDDDDDDSASSISSISADNDDNNLSLLFSTPASVTSPSYTHSSSMMLMDPTTTLTTTTTTSTTPSQSYISSFFSCIHYCFS
ncbi:uncharacterized protein BX664DRAFT_329288 [Halteromyces radiatus]|uniref:uncharacterized protein n=1 Tax=Halteromyces radiatus TaxID=101107 RepID=UPI0022202044|nr:uncharacterized protein BX664DRAFT_329288 [Halteromyces radiatus]KAI8093248.1 hypothetical protein BX664DRAFT_329288 [Halteromyces radiatus]